MDSPSSKKIEMGGSYGIPSCDGIIPHPGSSVCNTSGIIARYGLSNAKPSIVDFILQPQKASWR